MLVTTLTQACQQVLTTLAPSQVAKSLATRQVVVELQDDDKLLEQLVRSLLTLATL